MNRFEPAAIQAFNAAYERLSREGKCDKSDTAEYLRVFAEWQAMGCPLEGLDNFIATKANERPDLGDNFQGRESQN